MSIQYDAIGDSYLKTLPSDHLEAHSMAQVLGRVDGQRCLDLATGHGRGARLLLEHGALYVVGIDISEAMIQTARKTHRGDPRVDFYVGDCGRLSEIDGGPFGVVTSMWLLNYAANFAEMLAMFRNMHLNLKPGGRVVALTVNAFIGADTPFDISYGGELVSVSPAQDGGFKRVIRLFANPEKPYQFETYHFKHEIYERAAKEAGLIDLRWRAYVIPEEDTMPEGFWEKYRLRPHFASLTARKRN